MHFGITAQIKSRLTRGVAILLLGGLAAGCSSGAASLTDGLVTNSTSASAPVRPKVPVGNGSLQTASQTGSPYQQNSAYQPSPVAQGNVSSAPLPAPGSGQGRDYALAPAPSDSSNRPTATAPQQLMPPQSQPPASQAERNTQPPAAQAERSPAESQSASGAYTVASGDTLYSISRNTGVSVENIKQANSLSGNSIRVGQALSIPRGNAVASASTPERSDANGESRTKPVKTASDVTPQQRPEATKVASYTPPSNATDASNAGETKKPAPVQAKEEVVVEEDKEVASLTPQSTGVGKLRWPVRGKVISSFGGGGDGDGIDIAVPEGTSIHAAENGVVIYAGDGLKGFGNTVLVRHEDGLVTVYGHASKLNVKRGDRITRGQEIALAGMSGDADRPQLHFEVRKGTSPVDPMGYLQ